VWSEGIALVRGESSGSGQIRGLGVESKGKNADKSRAKEKGRGKGKTVEQDEGKKQGRILREWALYGGPKDDPPARLSIVEQTSFDLDKVSYCQPTHRAEPDGLMRPAEDLGFRLSTVGVVVGSPG
jgi:hypothetical protein